MPDRPGKPRRSVGIVTVARSDFGYYLPVLRRAMKDPALEVRLYASGMHLSPEFGMTVGMIEENGFRIDESIPLPLDSDSPECIARAMAAGIQGFGALFARRKPDILVVLGDRFDMYPAAVAALPFKLPVVHICGGELSEGAIDDALRHSMTKLSHLHLVETTGYARRVIQLGEEPWRVKVVGNPSLDNLRSMRLLSVREMSARVGFDFSRPFLLVTFHSTTLEFDQAGVQVAALLAALEGARMPVLFTMPNADTGGRVIAERIRQYVAAHPDAKLVDNLGTELYFSAMALAAAMVGNSSSGIVEAASFKLPVINVGNRQKGRPRPANVIDVGYRTGAIRTGLSKALRPAFRRSLRGLTNPFGDGKAAGRIVRALAVPLGEQLLHKRFHDLPSTRKAGIR